MGSLCHPKDSHRNCRVSSELQTQPSYMGGGPHLSHTLPSPSQRLGRYQIILLGDRGTVCEQPAQGCYLGVEWPGVKRMTSQSLVQYANHYTTKPQGCVAYKILQFCKQFVTCDNGFTSEFCTVRDLHLHQNLIS